MVETEKRSQEAIEVFKQCGTCSQTFCHILNKAFTHSNKIQEQALNPLAGGIMNQGQQCGMIWGASLASGAEAFRRHDDKEQAMQVAINATKHIMLSFKNETGSVDCKEVIGIDLSRTSGMMKFIIKSTFQGTKNNPCYNLAGRWAQNAIQTAEESLSARPMETSSKTVNCASQVVRKMGGTKEEIVMVAGFAGGLGLSGHACGALSAAIWMKTLIWCKEHPGKTPPFFKNKDAKTILKDFYRETDSKISCREITGQTFNSMEEHSQYITQKGCSKLIETLSNSVK
ncbi:MAG: C_GCAxxG_C_C family protein [Bacteroidetes bacterium]|nr:C_GCAxxG_C_C family protein [Bacteroidota bacterium]